jgi:type IV secretory pathway VirB10-like protein
MLGKKIKRGTIFNKKMLTGSVIAALVVGTTYYFASGSGSKSTSNVQMSKATTQDKKTGIVESGLIKAENEDYHRTQEQKAKEEGNSYLAEVGAVNTVIPQPVPKTKIDVKDNTAYDWQKERKKSQKKPQPKTEKPQPNSKFELSADFLAALNDDDKDKKTKVQTVSFNTIVAPDNLSDFAAPRNLKNDAPIIGKIMAGTTIYGVVKNKINSDFAETPVVAEVSFGQYKGAVVVGKFTDGNEWVTGLFIKFDKMIYKGFEFKINAIATNADYKPNLYDDVDNHWFMRIGGLVAGAGLGAVKGAAEPYSGANRPNIIVPVGGEAIDVYTPPDSTQVMYSAAGGAATDISAQLQPVFTNLWNRPATVTVDVGHGIGILFVQSKTLQEGGDA